MVYFTNGIGDRILNLPALRALAHFFGGRLRMLTSADRNFLCFNGIPGLNLVGVTTKSKGGNHRFDAAEALRKVPECDFFMSLVPYFNPDIAHLLHAWQPAGSMGFFADFKTHIPLNFGKHTCDLAFDLPQTLNPNYRLEDFAAPPSFSPEAWTHAKTIRGHLPPKSQVLAIHADTLEEKMWPAQNFRGLLDRVLAKAADLYAFVVGVKPLALDRIAHHERVVPLYGLPLETAMAVVAQADLFLGVDSCMLHVADIFHVPSVALFGPTEPAEFGCRFGPHQHLKAARMDALTVEAVLDAIAAFFPAWTGLPARTPHAVPPRSAFSPA